MKKAKYIDINLSVVLIKSNQFVAIYFILVDEIVPINSHNSHILSNKIKKENIEPKRDLRREDKKYHVR